MERVPDFLELFLVRKAPHDYRHPDWEHLIEWAYVRALCQLVDRNESVPWIWFSIANHDTAVVGRKHVGPNSGSNHGGAELHRCQYFRFLSLGAILGKGCSQQNA